MNKRKLLFIHQNFPAQFVHVARELSQQGHEVVALAVSGKPVAGVRLVLYLPQAPARVSDVDLARDFETKLVRAGACAVAMGKLKAQGFEPDIIVAHPGWGEAMFCKDIWPRARLLVYAEFFYSANGADYAFDPEFAADSEAQRIRLRLKNTVHLHALSAADAAYTPTHWQHRQLPIEYRAKTAVAFDGIDTQLVAPDSDVVATLQRQRIGLTVGDEVISFVNRNLEPYRGFHVFMRALPEILARRPKARCLIIGGDEVSYGSAPAGGGTWRQTMLQEVGDRLPRERVHFLGRVPYRDYIKLLQLSACHVYLTYPFVLSWSCLEAMSAQKVVVASRNAPVEEVIEHGNNGLLVDFFDTTSLANQVCAVLASPREFAALGKNARQSVIDRYDLRRLCLPEQLGLILGG